MKQERLAAIIGLACIVLAGLIVAAVEPSVTWAKDVALVAVGALGGIVYPSHDTPSLPPPTPPMG